MSRFAGISLKEKGILKNLYHKAYKHELTCSNPNCPTKNKKNIGCHVLQQNGILSELADEKGFIWELDSTDFFDKRYVRFSNNSIKNSRTFKFYGFCSDCDNFLFKEIESNKPNLISNYKHQLLFTYRSIVHELDKVKRNLLFYENVFNPQLPDRIKESYINQRDSYSLSQAILLSKKAQMESEIFPSFLRRVFPFMTRQKSYFYPCQIERLDIVISATYSNPIKISTQELRKAEVPIHYIHVIPQKDKSIVLFGCSSNVSEFFTGIDYRILSQLSQDKIQRMITDVILQRVETWGISHKFYFDLKKSNQVDRILKFKNAKIQPEQKLNPSSLGFNFFNKSD